MLGRSARNAHFNSQHWSETNEALTFHVANRTMKKSSESSSSKKKKSNNRTQCLGQFGFVSEVSIGGKAHQREIEPGQPLDSFKCPGCKKSFKNEQGVGNHAATCPAVQLQKKQKMAEEVNNNHAIDKAFEETMIEGDATSCSSNAKLHSIKLHQKRMDQSKNAVMLVEAGSNNSNCTSSAGSASCDSRTDNRKGNRGSSRRIRHANKCKASMIEFYENESGGLNVTQFCKKHNLPCNMIKNLSAGKHGWRHPSTRLNTLQLASESKHKNMKTKTCKNHGKSPFKAMEAVLHNRIKDHRKKGRKVSEYFTRINARKIMKDVMPGNADTFKASKGWFHRFLRRKDIKFRKRKSGKKATGEDNIDKIIKVSQVPSFILKNILTLHYCSVLYIFTS